MSSQWKLVPVEPTQSILDAMTTERKKGNGVLQMWFEAMAAAPAPPLDAEGVDFGIDGRSVRVSQEAYSIFLAREAAGREKIEALQQRLNAADQMVDELERDKARLDALESNFWIVRYTTSPNGDAGDYSNGIEIVGYWMDAPVERVIGENYSENLRAAIDQAMAAPGYPPARPEYPEPELGDDDWHMNPCKQGHRDVGASGGVAACNQCNEKIEAATTQEAFDQWNASHPSAHEKPVQPFTEQFIEDHLGKMPNLSQGS